MDTFDSNLDAFLEASQHVGGLIVSDQVGSAGDLTVLRHLTRRERAIGSFSVF